MSEKTSRSKTELRRVRGPGSKHGQKQRVLLWLNQRREPVRQVCDAGMAGEVVSLARGAG